MRRTTILLAALMIIFPLGRLRGITVGPVETVGHSGGSVPDPGDSLQWRPYTPDTAGPWPIVLIIHGGGFKNGNPDQPTYLVDAASECARNGFLALSINYRQDQMAGFIPGQTTTGFYPQCIDDARTILTAAYADPRWDGSKIFAIGGSAGGYLAAMLAGTGTIGVNKVAGAVCMSGPYDLSNREIDPDFPGSVTVAAADFRRFTNTPDDSPASLAIMLADSPVTLIDYSTISPVFITDGTGENMPHPQATALINALTSHGKVQGVDFFYTRASTPTHAFANWALVSSDVIAFFRAIIAGSPPPPPKPPGRIIVGPAHDNTVVQLSATGIIGGGAASWGNPHLHGKFKQYDWIDIQPDSLIKSATGVASTDVITSASHHYANGDPIVLLTATGGAGLTIGTQYFARDVTTNTFKIAAAAGGAAIDFTSDISAATFIGYDFSDIDGQLASGVTNSQQFLLLLNLNSGDPSGKSATGVASTDIITSNAHRFANGDPIVLVSITGGAGLVAGTQYYARDVTTNTFKVAATAGGAAIDFTTDISTAIFNGNDNPAWLRAAGAVAWPINNDNHGTILYQFLPWDPVFKTYALNFIAALGDHVDGKAVQVSMGGLGNTCEMHLPQLDQFPDGKDIPGAEVAYIASSNAFIAQYAAHLHKTTFTMSMAIAFPFQEGVNTLQSIVDTSLALYGKRIGFENWGLKNGSSNLFLPNAIIQDQSPTNPVGFQMTGNATTGGGGDLNGTLRQAMESGVSLGAQYLMVFGDDANNSIYYTDFDQVSAELAPPPP